MSGKYRLYYDWIMEVGEERLVEQKFLKENFYSREDYTVFLFILLRFSKKLSSEIRDRRLINLITNLLKVHFPIQTLQVMS